MKQQQRMKIMKDLKKKIRSNCRLDAENRWWVAELPATDCKNKTWFHSEEDETMQTCYDWLEKNEKGR